MAFAPSKKKGGKGGDEPEELRLEVVMNLICVLIPVLAAQQVVDYYQHEVSLPTRGGSKHRPVERR